MRSAGLASDGRTPRKVSPPSASYMNNDQFADYLADLRSNRITRPGGARPLPSGARQVPSRSSFGRPSLEATSIAESTNGHQRMPSQAPSVGAASVNSRYSTSSSRGRDYYPTGPSTAPAPLRASDVVPSATYIERGQRWMEKEEAHSLRDAMEEMDIKDAGVHQDEESRIYNAALDEAAELVWQHQHPGAVPEPNSPYRYKPHLRKNSYAHARTASVGQYGQDIAASGLARDSGSRSVSGSSTESDGYSRRSRPSMDTVRSTETSRNHKPYGSVGSRHSRRKSSKRTPSGENTRTFSGDQIWEEEAESTEGGGRASPNKLASKPVNHATRVRFESPDTTATKPLNKVEIQNNPPTRSRNPLYTTNVDSPVSSPEEDIPMKDGLEIRSDDIRAATSMSRRDRSPNLPEPIAVSDSPGRPIVSFDTNWKAPDESADASLGREVAASPTPPAPTRGGFQRAPQQKTQPVPIPSIVVAEEDAPRERTPKETSPAIPVICIGGLDEEEEPVAVPSINIPSISVGDAPAGSVPVIVTPDDTQSKDTKPRPLPAPQAKNPFSKRQQRPRGHWSPAPGSVRRSVTTCHECALPIEGRFVSLAGVTERFHPHCFKCFCCDIGLEAMEISPEPSTVRNARVDRIRRRARGEILSETPGETMGEDGDDRLRFFCHLDWHELFAPRCKHCKTPILGEHVVALGEHWHDGHFFCAECGDPFTHGMTHIEKDGYAWCVSCQTKRTERRAPKCRKCRTAVIGQYVEALGGEWHEACFRCAECRGGFDDGQIFPKEVDDGRGEGWMVVLCTRCRMRELKS